MVEPFFKIIQIFDSFGTDLRVKKASRLANQYQITSVLTLIINGKYKTSGSLVSSYEELYDVVKLLINKGLYKWETIIRIDAK